MLLNNCHHIERINVFFDNQALIDFFSVIVTYYIRTFYLCKSIYFVYITLCKENGLKLKLKLKMK